MLRDNYFSIGKLLIKNIDFIKYSENWLRKKLDEKNIYYIRGCGEDGRVACELLSKANLKVFGYIDRNQREELDGKKVFSPNEAPAGKNIVWVNASRDYEDEIDIAYRRSAKKDGNGWLWFSDFLPQLVRDFLFKEKCFESDELFDIYRESLLIFFGNYGSWGEALIDADSITGSGGYETDDIFETVKEATQKVLEGGYSFERDGHAFMKPEYNYELMTALLKVCVKSDRIKLLDFGGSLGSTYFQHKSVLPMERIRWNIVEQEHFVDYGKEHIKELGFFRTAEECNDSAGYDTVLFSSVLQYLDEPYSYLERILRPAPQYVIVDRTPFLQTGNSAIVNQSVPPVIYKAIYPAWLLNQTELEEYMKQAGYIRRDEWKCIDMIEHIDSFEQPVFKGLLFERG